MKYLNWKYLFILFLICCFDKQLNAQIQVNEHFEYEDHSGFRWGMYLMRSSRFMESSNREKSWSNFGLGVELEHQFRSGIGIRMRISYRGWAGTFDQLKLLPIMIGPSYEFPSSTKTFFSIYGMAGVGGVLGSDWGGFFANMEAGIQMNYIIKNGKSLFLGAGLGSGMSYHPSHFEYLELSFGIHF